MICWKYSFKKLLDKLFSHFFSEFILQAVLLESPLSYFKVIYVIYFFILKKSADVERSQICYRIVDVSDDRHLGCDHGIRRFKSSDNDSNGKHRTGRKQTRTPTNWWDFVKLYVVRLPKCQIMGAIIPTQGINVVENRINARGFQTLTN